MDGKGAEVASTFVAVRTDESIERVDAAWSGSVIVAAAESVLVETSLRRSVVSVKNENCELSGGVVNVVVTVSSESVPVGSEVTVVSPPDESVVVIIDVPLLPVGKVIVVSVPDTVPVAVSVPVIVSVPVAV